MAYLFQTFVTSYADVLGWTSDHVVSAYVAADVRKVLRPYTEVVRLGNVQINARCKLTVAEL